MLILVNKETYNQIKEKFEKKIKFENDFSEYLDYAVLVIDPVYKEASLQNIMAQVDFQKVETIFHHQLDRFSDIGIKLRGLDVIFPSIQKDIFLDFFLKKRYVYNDRFRPDIMIKYLNVTDTICIAKINPLKKTIYTYSSLSQYFQMDKIGLIEDLLKAYDYEYLKEYYYSKGYNAAFVSKKMKEGE